MKLLRGSEAVVAAACPATLAALAKAMPTDKTICRCIVSAGEDDVGSRRLLREQDQIRLIAIL